MIEEEEEEVEEVEDCREETRGSLPITWEEGSHEVLILTLMQWCMGLTRHSRVTGMGEEEEEG